MSFKLVAMKCYLFVMSNERLQPTVKKLRFLPSPEASRYAS